MTTQSSGVRSAVAVAAAMLAVTVFAPKDSAALTTKLEAKCASGLAKSAAKYVKTVIKETAKCKEADISGKTPDVCPNAGNLLKIAAAAASVAAGSEKSCKSVCSVSTTLECIADALCPPIVSLGNGTHENCSAGPKNQPFDLHRIGFPGPNCENALSGSLTDPSHIGQCVAEVSTAPAEALLAVIYGSLTEASDIDSDDLGCLKAISKGVQKLSSTVTKGVAKCHNAINGGAAGDPANCQTSDAKLVDKIAKATVKLESGIDSKCTPGSIAKLDICNAGVGGTVTLATAKACLTAAAKEISDSNVPPVNRAYGPVSLIDAAYPPPARCGDNVINQIPNALLLLGEECDGADAPTCPGECLPPGDLFECTCGNKARIRLFNNAALTDSDAGWTGDSHQQGVADLSGYVTELSNCDCDQFTNATCTGTTVDPVCDVEGPGLATCSWDIGSATRCDVHGNGDNKDENKDCFICDEFSANAGDSCSDERDCDAQCYDDAGVPTGPCENQVDCAAGEVCRGQCDREQTCFIVPNGAPLPVAAASASVCAVQRLRTDVTGTRNVVTGEHEINYRLFSIIHLGEMNTRPCPVCGGFCEGGSADLSLCQGRCTVSGDPCRFDADCPPAETCSSTSPDCPGGFCQLELVCGTDRLLNPSIYNQPCTIEYDHERFGSMSNDCIPAPSKNITGQGFAVDHLPDTSGVVTLPASLPCDNPGFELLDCPCPSDGGQGTQPNKCAPACNAVGPNFGVGCATGNSSGQGTTCAVGSPNAGKLCDEDSDCPGSSCSVNPLHCTGDPAFAQFACTTNADCGLGTCGDACPGGRCGPLCVPTLADPRQGICAAGPELTHCTGANHVARQCSVAAATAGCSATCSISGDPCVTQTDCDSGETCAGPCPHAEDCEAGDDGIIGNSDDVPGAAACELFDRSCFLDPIVADGGSTLDGEGDPDNAVTGVIWCFGKTTNPSVNSTSGFGGPGRVLSKGTNVTNGFTSIP